MGGFYELTQEDSERHYLSPEVAQKNMTADELDELLNMESMPVEYDGDLYWSDDINAADLH